MGLDNNLTMHPDMYESHITVDFPGQKGVENFKQVCLELKIKPILIILPVGEYPSQLMTAKFHRGEYEAVVSELYGLGKSISERGFNVTRHKLEAMVNSNSKIPLSDQEAKNNFPNTYFEFHIKVADPDTKLEELCKQQGVHLSKNASSVLNGKNQKFITARYPRVGRATAEKMFSATLSILKERNYLISHLIKEFTILDDNKKIDAGWAEPTISSCYGVCGLECPITKNI